MIQNGRSIYPRSLSKSCADWEPCSHVVALKLTRRCAMRRYEVTNREYVDGVKSRSCLSFCWVLFACVVSRTVGFDALGARGRRVESSGPD